MRPIHLELTAFGPYPRTQAIDFTALGGSDLFLVHGPTGAGKTSIFDGLTYALFGKLAGTRGVDRIRADRAEPSLQTRVAFTFRMDRETYRVERTPKWERPKKRGEGTTSEDATATLWRDGESKPLATGSDKVTAAVADILGMDVDQFTQVALLPQGEFRRLLVASSDEREELLQRLFATDRYVDIENLLWERKKKLEDARKALATRAAEVAAGEPRDAIAARLEEVRGQAKEAERRVEELRGKAAEAIETLSRARQLEDQFVEMGVARDAEAKAAAGAEAAEGDRKVLDRARAAERVRGLLDRVRQEEATTGAREREAREAEENASRARRALADAEVGAEAARKDEPERTRLATRIDALERLLPEVERLTALDAQAAAAGKDVDRAEARRKEAASALASAEEESQKLSDEGTRLKPLADAVGDRQDLVRSIEEALRIASERDALHAEVQARAKAEGEAIRRADGAREAAAQAKRAAETLSAAREEGLAAWLARTALAPGRPCPVCGALDHPAPATAEGHVPGEDEVATARETADRLERAAGEAVAARDRDTALLGESRARLDDAAARESRGAAALRAEREAAAKRLAEARGAAERLSKVGHEIERARNAAGKERALLDEAGAGLATAREVAGRAVAQAEELRRQLASAGTGPDAKELVRTLRADLVARQARADEALAWHRAAAEAVTAAATRLELTVKAHEEAGRALAEARGMALAAAGEAGFDDAGACMAALRPVPEQERLQASLDRRVADLLAARRRHETLQGSLAGLARPDVAAAVAAREATNRAALEAADGRTRLEAQAKHLDGVVARLEELRGEIERAEGELGVVGSVASWVRGDNPRKMSLHRFVLAARLEEVAEAASERLAVMTKGRFRLRHDTSVARRNSAAGLSLVVEDTWTGTLDRPVGALSGGESFLASLSLALGLSDVVLRHSGGRRLDSLFVDEGFGTLDEATLDVAIQALETLQQAGRLVGIISHVAELRRRIPARIEVTPTESGAVATVRAG